MKRYREKIKKQIIELEKLFVSAYKERLISLVIFGSVANDKFTPESDIDLLIILKNKRSSYEEFDFYFDNVENKMKFNFLRINPLFKDLQEMKPSLPFLWRTNFIILFDRQNFFKNFINELEEFKKNKIVIKENYEIINDK